MSTAQAKKRGTFRPSRYGEKGRDGGVGRGRKPTPPPLPETPDAILLPSRKIKLRKAQHASIDRELLALDALLADGRPKSRLERLCIERQIHDLTHGQERGLIWDASEADRAVAFFGYLKHWKGKWAGTPIELQPWQSYAWIRPLFGWYLDQPRAAGGLRRFRQGHCEVARKNGKTITGAGIALYGLLADAEEGAEVYCAASTRDQAGIVFRDSQRILGPELKQEVRLWKHATTSDRNDGTLKALSGDYGSLDGIHPHFILYDEVHAASSRDMYDVLVSALGAREHPLLLEITTAGFNRASICWDQRKSLIQTLEGVERGEWVNDSYFGYLATIDPDDDWQDPSVWRKSNPNLGISLFEKYLKEQHRQAIGNAAAENNFRTKHLNQWTASAVRWLDMARWDQCDVYEAVEDREKRLAGRVCYAGLDLAQTRDVTALVLAFPNEDGSVELLPYFFTPEDSVSDRARQDRLQVIQWADKGLIRKTPGNETDFGYVRREIKRLSQQFKLKALAFDPWHGTETVQLLQSEQKFPAAMLAKFPQGGFGSWAGPTPKLETLVQTLKLKHGAHPVLRWMAENVVVKFDPSGNCRPDKEKSQNKVDGIFATIMALGVWLEGAHARTTTGSMVL